LRTPCATGYVRWDGTGDRKGPLQGGCGR